MNYAAVHLKIAKQDGEKAMPVMLSYSIRFVYSASAKIADRFISFL